MVPNTTQPLPQQMLTNQQRCFVKFTYEKFHIRNTLNFWQVYRNYSFEIIKTSGLSSVFVCLNWSFLLKCGVFLSCQKTLVTHKLRPIPGWLSTVECVGRNQWLLLIPEERYWYRKPHNLWNWMNIFWKKICSFIIFILVVIKHYHRLKRCSAWSIMISYCILVWHSERYNLEQIFSHEIITPYSTLIGHSHNSLLQSYWSFTQCLELRNFPTQIALPSFVDAVL